MTTSTSRSGTSFDGEVAFLARHTDVVVLEGDRGARIAVAPGFQGRVMTSTADGVTSYGYVHRAGIEAGTRQPHITVLGGEDRFWLGPEGGQFSLYFAPGAPFDLDNWQVPEPLDWGAWPIVATSEREITLRRDMVLTSYARTHFILRVDRTLRVLGSDEVERALGHVGTQALEVVAYESDNVVTNTGSEPWREERGLLSIWILGMFNAAPRATVVIPFLPGPNSQLGPIVNDAYFGPVPAERLRVSANAIFYRGDGKARGKIGVGKPRARDVLGSFDPERHTLTLVQYTLPRDADAYVSSSWMHQEKPYAGDVVNSYNDGPPTPGAAQLGAFYELETSSPALALAPGESARHVHRTLHVSGSRSELDAIARAQLGVSLNEIEESLPAATSA